MGGQRLAHGPAPALNSPTATMPSAQKFHLLFSFIMGFMMIFIMTFVITWIQLGLTATFISSWLLAFVKAYVVGVPVIYFLAPVARKITAQILGVKA